VVGGIAREWEPPLTPRSARISPSPRAKPRQRRKHVAHGASRGTTSHSEYAQPRSGDRSFAVSKTALSPLPGLSWRLGLAFHPRLSPWALFLRPSADGLRNPIRLILAPMPPAPPYPGGEPYVIPSGEPKHHAIFAQNDNSRGSI